MVFKGCHIIPENIYTQAIQDKNLCEQSGGDWISQNDRVLGSCHCGRNESTKKLFYFIETTGCATLAEACTIADGEYYDVKEMSCSQLMGIQEYAKYNKCDEAGKFNVWEACVCPNGEFWRDSGNPKYCNY